VRRLNRDDHEYINISSHSSDNEVDISSGFAQDEQIDVNETKEKNGEAKAKKSGRGNIAVRVTSGVFALIFAVVGCISFWIYRNIENIKYKNAITNLDGNTPITTPEGEVIYPSDVDMSYSDETLLKDEYVLNIMLFGAEDQNLSDTMILLSLDNRHKKIKMTSFQRDTYVTIPGYYDHKLNLAYSLGGLYEDNAAGRAISAIEYNFGVRIDRYATVDLEAFKKIVDILGGVYVEVTASEIDYINAQIAQNGQTEYLYASPGMVNLNGQQAVWYARNRGGWVNGIEFSGDDWKRTDRQRKFLEAVINQIKGASLTELVEIVNDVGPYVTTNLKKTEIQALLTRGLTYLNYDIEKRSMPSEDEYYDGIWEYAMNHAGSVIYINNWYKVRENLGKFIYEDALEVSE